MTTLRINLHIREDISPRLFQALVNIPPRPRAELLRKIAELGLQIEDGRLDSLDSRRSSVPASSEQASAVASGHGAPGFGDDLAGLVQNLI